jgi:hypothetical protein
VLFISGLIPYSLPLLNDHHSFAVKSYLVCVFNCLLFGHRLASLLLLEVELLFVQIVFQQQVICILQFLKRLLNIHIILLMSSLSL